MAKRTYIYVGPNYAKGGYIHTREGQRVKPRDFSEKEIHAFTKRYPRTSKWWVIEEPAKPRAKKD